MIFTDLVPATVMDTVMVMVMVMVLVDMAGRVMDKDITRGSLASNHIL
jgi:hypothetical protein